MSINQKYIQGPMSSNNIKSINKGKKQSAHITNNAGNVPSPQMRVGAVNSSPAQTITSMPIPSLQKKVQKGQKAALSNNSFLTSIQAKLGWNISNPNCDVDVSAFLLNNNGKVLGDDWFVFYGQKASPDGSVVFSDDDSADREKITINFQKLNPNVSRIVFVLTINEAIEKHLNFSMLKDAYIRILDASDNSELVSFKMDEYYSNVTSMMIGEVYRHNGTWKFNAIGNGVARDLAGLCELYGVQVV
jgi:tellurium resistance protein TerD